MHFSVATAAFDIAASAATSTEPGNLPQLETGIPASAAQVSDFKSQTQRGPPPSGAPPRRISSLGDLFVRKGSQASARQLRDKAASDEQAGPRRTTREPSTYT